MARKFAKRHAETEKEFYWILISWWIKIAACILYAWMIVYYYQYGDPVAYKDRSDEVLVSISKNWENIKYIFAPVQSFRNYISSQGYSSYNYLTFDFAYYTEPTFMTSRICAVVAFFTFNRFLLISFVFTNFGYYGFVLIYTTLKKFIKGYNKELATACLFIPSCIFWSSALAKEPVCIISLGVIFSYAIKLFFERKIRLVTILKFVFFSYILLVVKNYIFFAFVFAFAMWVLYNRSKWLLAKSMLLRMYFLMLFLITTIGIGYFFWNPIIKFMVGYIGEIVSMNIGAYKSMASVKEGGGSFIQVKNIDFTSFGEIAKFTAQSLVTVFLRPFPWEINNVLMIFTVLENLFFIFLLAKVFIKTRLFTKQLFINKNYQVFAILFTLTMGFIIGISTFNFGSMVRYKMPFLPFWASFLLILNKKLAHNKKVFG